MREVWERMNWEVGPTESERGGGGGGGGGGGRLVVRSDVRFCQKERYSWFGEKCVHVGVSWIQHRRGKST